MLLASEYYRPPFPERRRWRQDLKEMRSAGLNAIYTWATWAWIEPAPGEFVFDDFDDLISETGSAGLGVIVNTIAELNPYWIHLEHPDSHHVDHRGRPVESTTLSYSPVGLVPGGCFDHPVVRELSGRFLEEIGRRYAGTDHLVAWDCWNEIRWNVQTEGHICFCPHTLRAYRSWLLDRYGDLDTLNAAWRRRHRTWEEVLPGKQPERNWTETIVFQEFLAWRTAEQLSFRAERLRAGDPDHQIVAHSVVVAPIQTRSENPWEQALSRGNDFELAGRVDAFGVSLFPAWFHKSPAETSARIEATRSAAGDRPFWVCELQGGSAKSGIGVLDPVPADLQQRWIWLSYGRGARGVSFWCWRDEVFGRESSGFGVTGNDGHAEARVEALKNTTAVLREHRGLLDAYAPDPACVAVVFEPLNHQLEWAQSGIDEQASPDSVGGYLAALERLQTPYDVVATSRLGDLSGYRVIVLPWPLVVRPAAAEALAAWVEAGGTLLVETEADAHDEHGFFRYADERPFAVRLGITGLGRRQIPHGSVSAEFDHAGVRGDLPLAGWIEPLDIPDGETLVDGPHGPLMVRRPAGAGTVIVLGTHAGRAYRAARSVGFEHLLGALLAEHGGSPALRCSMPDGEVVQWRTGRSGDARLLFVTNAGAQADVTFSGPVEWLPEGGAGRDLLTGRAVTAHRSGDEATLQVRLDAGGSHVILLPA
ncbi:beta-galactosidase [Actinomadura mexicana]|uniref:beta-galactosidase n=1 Tax=Actinomadura mexicana TaxID=134959 RepID=A0A238XEW6_9ACTN|nr:beta-galactosidase [Actinomadura mexicana]SNR57222.1 beta-galactosidase [Actinomadura mexicana]